MPLTFNDMLRSEQIEPADVLVLRHCPNDNGFSEKLPWLVLKQPRVFNAYQQFQRNNVAKSFQSAKHVASFLGRKAGCALFVGMYAVRGYQTFRRADFERREDIRALCAAGWGGLNDDALTSISWFDLELMPFFAEWAGKLVINWPGKELSWYRRAEKNAFEIVAVHEENQLDAAMPAWNELRLTWDELKLIPTSWKLRMAQWKGIYFIYDRSDGKGYVGAAYGDTNLLGRWENYKAAGHGNNKLLKLRDPANFSFSILERVSPDAPATDVIRAENTWKDRLNTRAPFGLNAN